jgi:outer membrane protein OmpA-like peptidoglycan-associated protein
MLAACGGAGKPRVLVAGTSISLVDENKLPIEIPFRVGSHALEARTKGVLDVLAEFLAENPDLTMVEVQGHSDERGTAAYNLELSKRRAKAVVDYLIERGIAATRLRSTGFGAERPAMGGAGEQAWSRNRRVEFVIISQTQSAP